MSDGGRFGGIRDEFDDEEEEVDEETEEEVDEETDEEGSSDESTNSTDETGGSSAQTTDGGTGDAGNSQQSENPTETVQGEASDEIDLSQPPFPYKDNMHQPIYVREDIWEEYERTVKFDVGRTLDQHGISEPTGREVGTAAIELVMAHTDELTERILERRGLAVSLSDE